ncbi:probable C-mannosyltransferase DPY19L3 isoform X1 [Corticium candelabrum]|uniref:probable C-mannosyltransferase DPY19L3 isoform X1 n=1 Tax=Corticium candelabrum TaxID=121492 RepID=UPI002E26FBC6|nr:probable C-mannosyltransferase DPY19L3 isoform X1 [Corticium candelabrum]
MSSRKLRQRSGGRNANQSVGDLSKSSSSSSVGTRSSNASVQGANMPELQALWLQRRQSAFQICGASLVLLAVLAFAYYWAQYLKLLHENYLWFSNIGNLEREISFRSEQGLYYFYYKQLVKAKSWSQGLYSLTHDNTTEHPRTINIIERFNVFQEIIAAALYRTIPIQTWEPIYFYIDAVFSLHGIYMVAVYCTAWLLSGSWISGLLSVTFFAFNRRDMTRIDFTVPLRENWAYPFLFLQLFFVTLYVKVDVLACIRKLALAGIFLSTLIFVLFWQFAQFILLPQVIAIYGIWLLGFLPCKKVIRLYATLITVILTGCFLQYGNVMLLGSLALSFMFAGLIVLKLPHGGRVQPRRSIWMFIGTVAGLTFLVITLTLLINVCVKMSLGVTSDQHIVDFVMTKIGLRNPSDLRDFDVLLYVCESSFQAMASSHWLRLTKTLFLPSYLGVLVVTGALLVVTIFKMCWSSSESPDSVTLSPPMLKAHPEFAHHFIMSILFGIMALSTLRCKFLWLPHSSILAAAGLTHTSMWTSIQEKLGISRVTTQGLKYVMIAGLVTAIITLHLPVMREELDDLREFHDPHIVELMRWIR